MKKQENYKSKLLQKDIFIEDAIIIPNINIIDEIIIPFFIVISPAANGLNFFLGGLYQLQCQTNH